MFLWKGEISIASLNIPENAFRGVGSQGNTGFCLHLCVLSFLNIPASLFRVFPLLSFRDIFFSQHREIFAYKMWNQGFFTNYFDAWARGKDTLYAYIDLISQTHMPLESYCHLPNTLNQSRQIFLNALLFTVTSLPANPSQTKPSC